MKPTTPLERVKAFLKQHGMMDNSDQSQIVRVAIRGQLPALLYTEDLRFVLDTMDRVRDLAYRANVGDLGPEGVREVMGLIFRAASGLPAGVPLPPVGRPYETVVTPEAVERSITGSDPFAAGGGQTRTRTCVHCLRRCGDAPGGAAIVDGLPVCYPNDLSRPNCYDNIAAGHPVRNCEPCCYEGLRPDGKAGEMPLEQYGRSVGQIRMGGSTVGRPPRKLGGPFGG